MANQKLSYIKAQGSSVGKAKPPFIEELSPRDQKLTAGNEMF